MLESNYSPEALNTVQPKSSVAFRGIWLAAAVFTVFCYVFYRLVLLPTSINDFGAHIQLIVEGAKHGTWPPHFLYHFTTYLFSLGSSDFLLLAKVSIPVLALAVTGKAYISYRVLSSGREKRIWAVFFCLSLLLVMPLFNWWHFPEIYLGQLSPNVWHNPTTIFVTPVALGLFFVTQKAIESFRLRDFAIASVLMLLNAASKPNYLLAFVPIVGLFFLYQLAVKVKKSETTIARGLIRVLLLLVPLSLLLYYQFVFTYGTDNSSGSSIIFAPLKVWRIYSPHIAASLLLSIAFPLVFSIAYFSEIKGDKNIILSWLIFGAAVMQFVLLAESGPRLTDGNFAWGSFIALYILFLTCTANLLNREKSAKFYLVFTVYLLHIISGSYYLGKLILG